MNELWISPSESVCVMIRLIAERLLPVSDELTDRMWEASQRAARQREYVTDPVLSESDRRLNRTTLEHWLTSNVEAPGRRVLPARDFEMLSSARDLVMRGMDPNEIGAWRAASREAWSAWIAECFATTDDRDALRELVEISANSLTAFLDDSITALGVYADEVRRDIGLGVQTQRHAVVQLLLQGSQIARGRAEEQLGYALTGHHIAVIAWVDSIGEVDQLEQSIGALTQAVGCSRRLTLAVSNAARWMWLPAQRVPGVTELLNALDATPAVRVAVGRTGEGLLGFRESHLGAVAAQRLLGRIGSSHRVVRYQDVQLVDLFTEDLTQADHFVTAVLGDLATADPDIQCAVRVFIDEGFNVSNTARRLFVHRNTIDRRLAKGRSLLPGRLDHDQASVGAALMLVELRQGGTIGS